MLEDVSDDHLTTNSPAGNHLCLWRADFRALAEPRHGWQPDRLRKGNG